MRTTVEIDDPILKEIKEIQKLERRSLGRLISDLLAQALAQRGLAKRSTEPSRWVSKAMGARFDLADRETLYTAMEQEPPATESGKRA